MDQGKRLAPMRHGKPKEGDRRKDEGRKIVVRLTDEQHRRLKEIVGDRSVSDFVRAKLLGGNPESGERSRNVYRKIAALHEMGLRLSAAAKNPEIDRMEITGLLVDIRSAISHLAIYVDPPSR